MARFAATAATGPGAMPASSYPRQSPRSSRGFPFASVFKQPVSTLQSLEPAIRTSLVLFGINLLFLLPKVTPKSVHLHIEIAVSRLFASIVLFAVRPFKAKIGYSCKRFFNRRYPPVKMVSLGIHQRRSTGSRFRRDLFPGLPIKKFRLVLKPRDTVLLQGLIFGIIHLNPATYISHTMMGMLFGFLRHRTNSLLPGMLFHALWSLSVVGWEYWRLTAEQI
jgi:hypothetical protein